jgi:hypothetical protein
MLTLNTQKGGLLGISAKMAEELASTMIEQGRMSGSIDQIEALVEFDDGTPTPTYNTYIYISTYHCPHPCDDLLLQHHIHMYLWYAMVICMMIRCGCGYISDMGWSNSRCMFDG